MILEEADNAKHGPLPKDRSQVAKEERGEMAFAVKCAEKLLKWLELTQEQAKHFVDAFDGYYLGGNEVVEIPALVEGLPDHIFPDMGAMR
jgi:hypothetical protein